MEQLAAAFAIAALVNIGLTAVGYPVRRAARRPVTLSATACLVSAGVLGAVAWRVQTAGSTGSNIGGGFFSLAGPVGIAGLLLAAVRIERGFRGGVLRRSTLLTGLAVSVGVVLLAVPFGLTWYDDSIGAISPSEYGSVHVDDSQAVVRHRLGRPLQAPVDWFFAAAPAGARCDYYSGPGSLTYQICYDDGMVATIKASAGPAATPIGR